MNVERWAQVLKEEYPRGLLGEREALVSLLVGKGLSHAEAVEVARALEAQGYAHFLPGERPRWFFSSRSLDLKALMRALDQEFPEFVGEGDEEEEKGVKGPEEGKPPGQGEEGGVAPVGPVPLQDVKLLQKRLRVQAGGLLQGHHLEGAPKVQGLEGPPQGAAVGAGAVNQYPHGPPPGPAPPSRSPPRR